MLVECVLYYIFIGCCHRKPLLVPGGRAFVWPGIQHVQRYLCFSHKGEFLGTVVDKKKANSDGL